jgi:hypothetical protein
VTSDANTRTRQYTGGRVSEAAVTIVAGDALATPGGQAALLGAANALVRNHPAVYVVAPDAESVLAPTGRLSELLTRVGGATDESRLEIATRPPVGPIKVGIGSDVEADLYVGADRFTGFTANMASPISGDPTSVYGAAVGAMLAAGQAFRRTVGMPVGAHRGMSLWTLEETLTGTGPDNVDVLDLSALWLVGAGGVGSSAAWWMYLFGCCGTGVVIDHDLVDITNLNRSLGMFYRDTGLAEGTPRKKAELAADLIGAAPFTETWDAWIDADPVAPDLLIPAANEFGVRTAIATYSHPMAFTGTTSRNWTAELHLYRAGVDSCPSCRHPDRGSRPAFACSTSSVPTDDGGSEDAALSFLSGTAGLLAVAGLTLAQAGELTGPMNMWPVDFAEAHRGLVRAKKMACTSTCRRTQSQSLRSRMFGDTRHGS